MKLSAESAKRDVKKGEQQSLHISSLWVRRLGKLENFGIDFPSPPTESHHFGHLKVSVLVGENGTGKTSILRFLSQVMLSPIPLKALKSSFDIRYSIGNEVQHLAVKAKQFIAVPDRTPAKVIVSSYTPFEQFQTYAPSERYEYIGPVASTTGAGMTSLATAYIPIISAFYGFGVKSEELRSLLSFIGVTTPPLIRLNRSLRLHGHILRSLVSPGTPIEAVVQTMRERYPLIDPGLVIRMWNLCNYPTSRYFDPETYPGGVRAWLLDVEQARLQGMPVIQGLWFPTNRQNQMIPMARLSSGQLSLFFRFFRLIHAMQDDSLVLIDEPETHLHPRWIQKYVEMLRVLFGKYRAHIVLATHSPMIVSDVPRECVIALKQDGRKVVQVPVADRTMGRNLSHILEDVFGLNEAYGERTSGTIAEIENLIDKDPQRALALYHDLGDSPEKYRLYKKLSPLRVGEDHQ